jgi:hypothetical protein
MVTSQAQGGTDDPTQKPVQQGVAKEEASGTPPSAADPKTLAEPLGETAPALDPDRLNRGALDDRGLSIDAPEENRATAAAPERGERSSSELIPLPEKPEAAERSEDKKPAAGGRDRSSDDAQL